MFRPRPSFLLPGSSFLCSGGPLGPCFSFTPGCHPERSEGSAFSSSNFELSTVNLRAVTPFPATLANLPQVNENKTTLSLSFATLTSHVTRKFVACHSYKKHRGWGDLPAPRSSQLPFKRHNSGRPPAPKSNFYPPASDLRHNPAAQGQHPQSIAQSGRIQ